jgi:hypothetical protein
VRLHFRFGQPLAFLNSFHLKVVTFRERQWGI